MPLFKSVMRAVGTMAIREGQTVLGIIVAPKISAYFKSKYPVQKTSTGLISEALLSERTKDGAIISGLVPPNAYAKFALPKGLPKENKRTLAIINPSHTLDSFDGVILSGYGRGIKTLLNRPKAIIKSAGKSWTGTIEYHVHDADRAGLHYDLAIEGLTQEMAAEDFEVHIPNGEGKGRYAFVHTNKGIVVVPMKDKSVIYSKPDYKLKDESFLQEVDFNPTQYIVEQKLDGSLTNCRYENGIVHMRSHRETTNTYHSKLPQLEYLFNTSSFFIWKKIAPMPDLNGTEWQAELVHQDGVSRASGILNAYGPQAIATQDKYGKVEGYIWDVVKYKGRDVTNKSYALRRQLAEEICSEISLFSKYWHVVEKKPDNISTVDYYQQVIKLPLPYGEGLIIKDKSDPKGEVWFKIKDHDYVDAEIISYVEGKGRLEGSLGTILVRDTKTGSIGEVGTGFTDYERDWIYHRREELVGAIVRVKLMETTNRSLRAPVWAGSSDYRFEDFAPDARKSGPGSELGLYMYADALAVGIEEEATRIKYKLINS